MQHPLPCSSISKHADHHISSSFIMLCKSKPRPCSYLCTYNTMSSKELFFHSKKVHASAISFAAPGSLSKKLSHAAFYTYALCYCKRMVAVTGNKYILGLR